MVSVCVDEFVGANDPVGKGGAVDVAGFLKDVDAWGIGGGNVGIDLMKGCVLATEVGKGLDHGRAMALVPIFVGNNNAYGRTAIDGVVVVEFDAAHRTVVGCEGIEGEFARGEGVALLCFECHGYMSD